MLISALHLDSKQVYRDNPFSIARLGIGLLCATVTGSLLILMFDIKKLIIGFIYNLCLPTYTLEVIMEYFCFSLSLFSELGQLRGGLFTENAQ